MTSSGSEPTEADALRAAAPPSDDIVAASARARVAASLFPSAASDESARTPLVGDRYEVSRKIGSGGMGVVYEAFDPQLQRKVAVKVLHPDVAVDERAKKRMLREARSLAALSHPNVIGVHDVGEADDQVFVAMELVEGPTLRAFVDEQAGRWQPVLERYVQAGRGLAAAHAAGLVHRDFKPDNALVGADGRVRVLDFGLARRAQELTDERELGELLPDDIDTPIPSDDGATAQSAPAQALVDSQLTDFGAIVGTPRYMAPEQFDAGIVDAASDQFSFCVALYEALYQSRPYRASTVPKLAARVVAGKFEPAPRGGPVPDFVADAIERGLRPKKEDRWPRMDALLDALEQAIERPGSSSLAGVEVPPVALAPPTKGGARIAWAVALVAVSVAAAVFLLRRPSADDAQRPRDETSLALAGADEPGDTGGRVIPDPGAATTDVAEDNPSPSSAETEGGTAGGALPGSQDVEAGSESGEATAPPAPVRPRPITDVCHMTEDGYDLIVRGKRRRYLSTDEGCLKCRRRRTRTDVFIPSDCQAYMVCGPVSSEQCR